MPKLLLLLSCWLVASGSFGQSPPAGFPDTPTITENSVGRARIGMPVTQLKEVYKGCTFVPTHLMKYGFDDTDAKPNGVIVSRGSQRLFLYFLDGQTKKKVAGILAFHPAYRTVQEIHVGSTSGELKAVLPAIRTVSNVEYPGFQLAFLEKSAIEYDFLGREELGPQDPNNYDSPVPIIVKTQRISWIQVYPH